MCLALRQSRLIGSTFQTYITLTKVIAILNEQLGISQTSAILQPTYCVSYGLLKQAIVNVDLIYSFN